MSPGNFPELGLDRRRPGLIICPGGGYASAPTGRGSRSPCALPDWATPPFF